jgi:MFS family permease
LLGSSFFWVFAILVPVAGSLGDVLSRKNLIVLALLLWSTATFLSGLVGGFALLLVFRALTGTGEAFYYPAANSMISDYHGQPTRALAMGIHQTSVYLGIIVSGTLAGYIGEKYGWRWAFLSFGVAGILLALAARRLLREPGRGQSDLAEIREEIAAPQELPLWSRIVESFHSPTALVFMAAFMGMKLVDAAYLTWMPTLLYRKFSMTLAGAGFHATFWHHAGAMLGVLLGGRTADRLALRSRVSRPAVQVAGLLLGAPFIFLLGWSNSIWVVFTSLGLFGIFRGLYDSNLFASLYEVVRPEARATATGIMIAVAFLGGGCSPLLIGWLSGHTNLGLALASTSAFYIAAGLLIWFDCRLWFHRDAARMRAAAFGAVENVQPKFT